MASKTDFSRGGGGLGDRTNFLAKPIHTAHLWVLLPTQALPSEVLIQEARAGLRDRI